MKKLLVALTALALMQCTPAPGAEPGQDLGSMVGQLRTDEGVVISLYSGSGACPEGTGAVVSRRGQEKLQGCWIRNANTIAIRWENGMLLVYPSRRFGFGPSI